DRGADHAGAVWPLDRYLIRPSFPPIERFLEARVELLCGNELRRCAIEIIRGDVMHGEAHALVRADRKGGAQIMALGKGEIRVTLDDERIVAADGAVEADIFAPDPRLDRPVVEAESDMEMEVDAAAHTLDDAEELAVRFQFAAAAHRETV